MNRLFGFGRIVPLIAMLAASCSTKQKPVFEGSSTFEATEIVVSSKTAGTVLEMADAGHLGRKTGGGFYQY